MQVTFQKLLRIAAGYSQAKIAALLEIDPSLVSRYENGTRPMPKTVKRAFVKACAKRVHWKPLLRQAAK